MQRLVIPGSLCLLIILGQGKCGAATPPITAIAYSPDGKSIVYGSQAGLRVTTGSGQRPTAIDVKEKIKQIHAIRFAPDGMRAAICGGSPSESGKVMFMSWPRGEITRVLRGFDDTVHDVCWRADSRELAAVSLDGGCRISEKNRTRWSDVLVGHSRGVTAVVFLPGSSELVTGSLDRSLRRWDIATRSVRRTFNNHTAAVVSIALSPSNDGLPVVVTGSNDRTIRFWQPTIGRMIRFTRLPEAPVDLVWSLDGNSIWTITRSGYLYRIEQETAEISWSRKMTSERPYCMTIHPNGQQLAIGASRSELLQIDVGNAERGR